MAGGIGVDAGAKGTADVPEIGVGMLGYAFMGKAHANGYKTLSYMAWPPPLRPRLVSIAGRDESAVAEAATRYGFERYVTDWREQVADPDVQLFDNGLVVEGLPTDHNPGGRWWVDAGLGDALYDPMPLVDGVVAQGPTRFGMAEVGVDALERRDQLGAAAAAHLVDGAQRLVDVGAGRRHRGRREHAIRRAAGR